MIKTIDALKQKLKRDIAYWENRVSRNPDKQHKAKLNQVKSIKHWLTEEGL